MTGGPRTEPIDARAVLGRCRDAVAPALRAAVARLDPASREQATYHLGWTELDGRPGAGGGKAVRPALALISAAAAGAPIAAGLPGAVAVELVHNFSLLHDDLMDGDTERRHRRTVWAQWGAAAAILTGDALLALAHEVLLEAGSPDAAEAARLLAATVRELIRGQAEDVAFEQRDDVTVSECLAMAAGKTGSLLATSAAVGSILAGGPAGLTAALHGYGAELGMAFQLVDDLLGIWGDPAVTGKPVLSDLRSRKMSLPVTYAVHHGGAAGRELARWLAAPGPAGEVTDEPQLRRIAALVEDGGGRDWAAAEARRRMALAEKALAGAELPDRPRAELVALGRYLVDREF
ncbi:polyprenyl synthetase family protein [Pseudonocardia asaccharolytica]|uniref:(2E,6E)-farnesyl diphosphate synthase n=1 Tax=Pseudonocardia asaccharolytica DSM 44247 = NBRC 16224 TaxID=1123024 RepID=A0A511CXQ6_9PSEU|nr:polyprenyl synthetase family protein [Pseudonocardia asaccharolytica]GEL17345.1 (2E,6E)-farnesyl diphosphate synthase [Pseudonocardia asaccharolytica DSM 44247 = NBRC 16224]